MKLQLYFASLIILCLFFLTAHMGMYREGFMAPIEEVDDRLISQWPSLLAPEYPDQRCEINNEECSLPSPHGGKGGFCHMKSENGRVGFCIDDSTCCPHVNYEPPQVTPEHQRYERTFTYIAECDRRYAPGPDREKCYILAANFAKTLDRKKLD